MTCSRPTTYGMMKKSSSFQKSVRRKSRKASKSRRKSPCAPGKTRAGTGRCHLKKSPARKSRKAPKSRRKSLCAPGKTRAGTGRCHLKKSPKRKSRKASKSVRRKPRKASKSVKRKSQSLKKLPGGSWRMHSPGSKQRTVMLKNCGKKCFLGPDKSFPICSKNTCKVNPHGVHAAYVRAKQWGGSPSKYKGRSRPTMNQSTYQKIARSAKSRLAREGYNVK